MCFDRTSLLALATCLYLETSTLRGCRISSGAPYSQRLWSNFLNGFLWQEVVMSVEQNYSGNFRQRGYANSDRFVPFGLSDRHVSMYACVCVCTHA